MNNTLLDTLTEHADALDDLRAQLAEILPESAARRVKLSWKEVEIVLDNDQFGWLEGQPGAVAADWYGEPGRWQRHCCVHLRRGLTVLAYDVRHQDSEPA